jgi:hypothetical protein
MEVETAPSELDRSPQIRSNRAMIWVIFRPNQAISLTSTNYRSDDTESYDANSAVVALGARELVACAQ